MMAHLIIQVHGRYRMCPSEFHRQWLGIQKICNITETEDAVTFFATEKKFRRRPIGKLLKRIIVKKKPSGYPTNQHLPCRCRGGRSYIFQLVKTFLRNPTMLAEFPLCQSAGTAFPYELCPFLCPICIPHS